MDLVPSEVLKVCDIRGVYPKPLGFPQAEKIGLALGTLIKDEGHRNIKVVVGHDVRRSGENLQKALVQGLQNTGLKILDAGRVSSPLLAYATRFSGASVGVMVTASHNPPEHNGFKFFPLGLPASPAWMERFYARLKKESFRKGAGVVEKKDFYPDYRNALVNAVAQNFQGFKMVVDAGNGSAALTVPAVLKALHCDPEILNGEPDGRFPGRGADSSSPSALKSLGDNVLKAKARLGVAFDGDADRVSFVDEKGQEVPNELILCLFAEESMKRQKNLKVVYDGKCSDWIEKTIQGDGGTALLEKSGHAFIFDRMQREKAVLGGEASGHFFLPGAFPGDALFASLKLLELLKERRQTLSALRRSFPDRVSTHDIKLELPPEQLSKLYESLADRAREMGAQLSDIDGVRAVFSEGWGIVRRSVTESYVSCRLEAPTAVKLKALASEWFLNEPELQQMVLKKINKA